LVALGSFHSSSQAKQLKKLVFTASLLDVQHYRNSVKISQQVCWLCPWAGHLVGLPLPLSDETGSNRWQLDSKTENIPLMFPGGGSLKN